MQTYDYIVIGAGSAGCVLTTRLVEVGKSVLLLEAGPNDGAFFQKIPGGLTHLKQHFYWKFFTEPNARVNNRKIFMRQGRGVGGSSSVNGMVYIRGQRQDYDGWRDAGCDGWGYEDVLPAFRRSEAHERLSNEFHGADGELPVSDSGWHHPLSYAFVRAGQEAGLPYNDDFNGASQEGVGFYHTTTKNAERQSASVAFLSKVRSSPLLTLRTEAAVQGLVLENGAAVGVRFKGPDNSVHEARVREEVILSSGVFGSAKILQLSGIGPGDLLSGLGIQVQRDIAGVGENFQDHYQAGVYGRTRDPISLFGEDKGLRAIKHGLQWMLFRQGVLTSNMVESGGFADTQGVGRPDIQFTVVATLTGDADRPPLPGHGISISPCVLRPVSRGRVRIKSADPTQSVAIWANALSAPEDEQTLLRGVKLARKILRAPSLAKLIAHELAPGDPTNPDPTDAQMLEHARKVLKTVYHPCGTCRMGSDADAVVDPKLRVQGVPRLRVADASIMPSLVSGNTNAPSIMIGARCADFLLAR